ncbi:MAG: metal-dependent hydrolase [Nanoarchaeota archaeon]|nr:metal-dependent hydrolase [Nanoarchaeota archaeon]
MPFAVTHVLITIIIIDLFRKIILKKKNFPLHLVLIGGIAGLLPDIDVAVFWVLQTFSNVGIEEVHKVFTHSLIIPLVIFIGSQITLKWKKISQPLLVISAGYTIHLLLDSLFYLSPLFYPFSSTMLGINLLSMLSFDYSVLYMSIDAVILVSWLIYEWKAKNIRDYI